MLFPGLWTESDPRIRVNVLEILVQGMISDVIVLDEQFDVHYNMHLHKNIDVYLITVSLRFEHKSSDTKVSTTI